MSIHDAKQLLLKAKDQYATALAAVDARLRAAVRADPRCLPEAKAIQNTYHQGFVSVPLAAMVAPSGGRLAEPPKTPSVTVTRED